MNSVARTVLAVALLTLLARPLPAPAQAKHANAKADTSGRVLAALPPADHAELQAFSARAFNYIKLTRALPAHKLAPTTDLKELESRRVTLRQAIQQARSGAKRGDIFTPASAEIFRNILNQIFTGPGGAKVRTSLIHAEPVSAQSLTVNGVYPNVAGQPLQSVPSTILFNLPMLPHGLEYRISSHALALRDTDANMVVDFLPDAIP